MGKGHRTRVTQAEIARKVGIDVSSVNKILNNYGGGTFHPETVEEVFKIAKKLGYDLTRLKHPHRRRHPRKEVAIGVELSVYCPDGTVQRGSAMIQNLSLSGALLQGVVLPQQSLPLYPKAIGIRPLEGPGSELEVLGHPVRFDHSDGSVRLAIEFLKTEELKSKKLWQAV